MKQGHTGLNRLISIGIAISAQDSCSSMLAFTTQCSTMGILCLHRKKSMRMRSSDVPGVCIPENRVFP